ncbi:hypothetical protein D3C72_1633280 [compost metagenome]
MAGHHIHAQQLAGIHHVLGVRPQRSGRSLPGIAAIKQQCTRARSLHALDQGRQVCKTAHLAVTLGCRLKIQVAEGMRTRSSWPNAAGLQQMFAHQMGALVLHGADAQIHARLTEINGFELRVAVGHVQQRHIAKLGHIVQRLVSGGAVGPGVALQAHATDAGCRQHLQKFAFGEAHGDKNSW